LCAAAGRSPGRVNAPHLVALVRAGATFVNGKLVERVGEHEPAANQSQEAADEVVAAAA
jgi:hypothetical protein